MINPRSIATLGIGFGVLAITTLGTIAETQSQELVANIEIIATSWPVISLVASAASITTLAAWPEIITLAAYPAIDTMGQNPEILLTGEQPIVSAIGTYPIIEVTYVNC